jgi:phosphoketolase
VGLERFETPILSMDEALEHCSRAASTWKFATNDGGEEPDVVLACAGDVPDRNLRGLMASAEVVPGIKVRVVNVVDLIKCSHDAGRSSARDGQHVLQRAVHQKHRCHLRRPYQGKTTTPFDMVVLKLR